MEKAIRLSYPFKQVQRISNPYSLRDHHEGLDFAAVVREHYREFYGTPTVATHRGKVITGYSVSGYGVYVYLLSEDYSFATLHAHLAEILVKDGEWIEDQQPLGLVGCTGNCKPPGTRGTHLHYGFRFLPAPAEHAWPYGYVDPTPYMEMPV